MYNRKNYTDNMLTINNETKQKQKKFHSENFLIIY